MAEILVVEDEKNIRLFLHDLLTEDGYHVTVAEDGDTALFQLSQFTYDLVLLDLKLKQGIDGIDILKSLRQENTDTCVIILTAFGSLESAVQALRLGAQDYLFKPCQADELRQSVRRGLIQRQREQKRLKLLSDLEQNLSQTLNDIRGQAHISSSFPENLEQTVEAEERFLRHGRIIVDKIRHSVTYSGYLLRLTPIQYKLINYLVQEAPRVVSHKELVHVSLGYEVLSDEASNILRPHIYRLRQKFESVDSNAAPIHTVRGIGYHL